MPLADITIGTLLEVVVVLAIIYVLILFVRKI